ncbi:cytochrome P450 [Nocardia sp. NBC_01499]|uniref:cytochrome P450 n=1 Tax=Nocardia sp. NBC_01499 TaxID=2903597 RepID=UPI00386E17CA
MSIVASRLGLGPLPAFLDPPSRRPVQRVPVTGGAHMWLVTEYALGRMVLSDKRFSRAAAARPEAPKWHAVNPSPNSIMSMDGAEHARLRRIAAAAFTAKRVAELAPFIERTADELLDTLAAGGRPADLVSGYTAPLPVATLGALLGVPAADRPRFEDSVVALFGVAEPVPDGEIHRARHELILVDYMSSLISRKRREPQDDFLSVLIRANDGGTLSQAELINFGLALLMAGYETTAGQLSMSVLALLSGGTTWDAVDEKTIEELIRTTPTTPVSFPRVAVEDVPLGETVIRAGEAVIVSLVHCNHDDSVFAEPDPVGGRRPAQHLTFGHGVHHCLGAPLARLQLKIALPRLWQRFPGLRLAEGAGSVRWKDGLVTRGLARLDVTC